MRSGVDAETFGPAFGTVRRPATAPRVWHSQETGHNDGEIQTNAVACGAAGERNPLLA